MSICLLESTVDGTDGVGDGHCKFSHSISAMVVVVVVEVVVVVVVEVSKWYSHEGLRWVRVTMG